MNMIGVPVPRAHLGHPGFVFITLDPTEFFFYRSIDQDPFDLGLFGSRSDKRDMGRTPDFTVDALAVGGNHVHLARFDLARGSPYESGWTTGVGARTWTLPNHRERWRQISTNMTQALTPNVRELWPKPSFVNFPSPHTARATQIPVP